MHPLVIIRFCVGTSFPLTKPTSYCEYMSSALKYESQPAHMLYYFSVLKTGMAEFFPWISSRHPSDLLQGYMGSKFELFPK